MTKYNHAYTVAFSLISETHDGSDVTPEMLIDALEKRIENLMEYDEWEEAVGSPYDTCVEEE